MSTNELTAAKRIVIETSANSFITKQRKTSFRRKRIGYKRFMKLESLKDRIKKITTKIMQNYPSHTAR